MFFIAALDLLAKHAEQFDSFIYEDYKDLFDRISQWAQHKNYDMKKLGYTALDSYYKQVSLIEIRFFCVLTVSV